MYSHITQGTNDLEKAIAFYDPVLEAVGIKRQLTMPEHDIVDYGPDGQRPQLFILKPFDRQTATHGNGAHVAFMAPNRAAADAFHAAALAAGGTDEGAPGPRPHCHEH